jgi:hypothetical protein
VVSPSNLGKEVVTVRILTAERLDYTPRDSATLMCYSSP